MRFKPGNAKDFFAGLLFFIVGVAAVLIGRDYPIGSTSRMGPGYFPVLVGGLLVLIGLVLSARSLRAHADAIGRFALKPTLLVVGAVALFAASIEKLGFAAAVLLVVVIGYVANPRPRVLELLLLAAVLTAGALGIFVYGLKLPLKVWPLSS